MSCAYCHMEGDPLRPGGPSALPDDTLAGLLRMAARRGVRTFKFLGGEPLVHPVVQPLTLSRAAMLARLSQVGGTVDARLDFFDRVGALAAKVARAWGLVVLPPLATDQLSPSQCAEMILRRHPEPALAFPPGNASPRRPASPGVDR